MSDQSLLKSAETSPSADSQTLQTVQTVGGVAFSEEDRTLASNGRVIRLEPKAGDVLAFLVAQAGTPVSRLALLDEVWGDEGSDEALTQAISRLRRAVRDLGGDPGAIETVPRVGYRIVRLTRSLSAAEEPPREPPKSRSWLTHGLAFVAGMLVGMAILAIWALLVLRPATEDQRILISPDGKVITKSE